MEKLKSIRVDEANQLLIIESASNKVNATLSYSIGDNMTKFSRDLSSFSNGVMKLAQIREQGSCSDSKS